MYSLEQESEEGVDVAVVFLQVEIGTKKFIHGSGTENKQNVEPEEICNLVHAVEEELDHISDFLEHTEKRQDLESRKYHYHEIEHYHEELCEIVVFVGVIQRWYEIRLRLDHSDCYL